MIPGQGLIMRVGELEGSGLIFFYIFPRNLSQYRASWEQVPKASRKHFLD